jgi:preprotein translocase subunit YajC
MRHWLGFADTAYAMGQAPGGPGGAPAGPDFGFFFVLPIIILIFWLLVFRPQQARVRKHQEMLKAVKRGDSVYTTGGVMGKVTGLTDKVVTLEIADNVRVKVYRNFIAGLVTPGEDVRPEGST